MICNFDSFLNVELETQKKFSLFFTLLQQVKLDKEYDIRGVAIQGRYHANYAGWYVTSFDILYRKTVGGRSSRNSLKVS